MELKPEWEFVSDRVMGGLSLGRLGLTTVDGLTIARLTGNVSLENNGGFVQIAFDLVEEGQTLDASAFTGVVIDVLGNGEIYDLRLRTTQFSRPWQSFRCSFVAGPAWQKVHLPFSGFVPHRTEVSLDPSQLRRIGVLAIGRRFEADISVRSVAFYK